MDKELISKYSIYSKWTARDMVEIIKPEQTNNQSIEEKIENTSDIEKTVVYLNKPISKQKDDHIGFDTQINAIEKAIKDEARIIGIISDFGTGKSSLTELLGANKKYKIIKINLWDCLKKTISEDLYDKDGKKIIMETEGLTAVTKSFLFQLASIKPRLASHINKKLSKNFGVLSFTVATRMFWFFLGIAGIMYSIFLALSNPPPFINFQWLFSFLPEKVLPTLQFSRGLFLVVSIAVALYALKKADISFSHWDSQGKRIPETIDVFETYIYIINKITSRFQSIKKLVIIEDLDRIEEKDIVFSFLQELYRFNNLLPKKSIEKIVFLTAVKEEHKLTAGQTKTASIYPKIFDFIIELRPIHNDDYKSIILSLLKEKENEIKLLLGESFGLDLFPSSFEWIVTGENLTIRDLKHRLNHALMLYANRKKLDNDVDDSDLRSCMAVAYLENTYSDLYGVLIRNEKVFSQIIDEAYIIKNTYHGNVIEQKSSIITKINVSGIFIENTTGKKDEFVHTLADMLCSGDINDDFRMFFYSYPKGSYVKNSDEKWLSNIILLPTDNIDINEIDERIKKTTATSNAIISQAYESLKNRKLLFPIIIFENKILFDLAVNKHQDRVIETMYNYLQWETQNYSITKKLFSNIFLYNKDHSFLEKYLEKFVANYISNVQTVQPQQNTVQQNEIIMQNKQVQLTAFYNFRITLIELLQEHILEYAKILFLKEGVPIISKDEMNSNLTFNTKLKLIKESLVSTSSIDYIYEVINNKELSDSEFEQQKRLFSVFAKKNSFNDKTLEALFETLLINKKLDNEMLLFILGHRTQSQIPTTEKITEYLNKIDTVDISSQNLAQIDKLLLDTITSNTLLKQLYDNKLYFTYFASMIMQNKLSRPDIENVENVKNILQYMPALWQKNPDTVMQLRKHLLETKKNSLEPYKILFFGNYPLLEETEVQYFNSYEEAVQYFDFSKFITSATSVEVFAKILNSKELAINEKDAFLQLFQASLNPNSNVAIRANVIKLFDLINFDKLKLHLATPAYLESFAANLVITFGLNSFENCLNFMKKIQMLIPYLELNYIKPHLSNTENAKKYFDLVNEIENPSTQTLVFIQQYGKDFGFTDAITQVLYETNNFANYITGRTYFHKKFEFEKEKIDISIYLQLFSQVDKMFNYMKENTEFLDFIILNNYYTNFNISRLESLYSRPQKRKLIEHIFSVGLNNEQKTKYLQTFANFADSDASLRLVNILSKTENIHLIQDTAMYDIIAEKMEVKRHKDKLASSRAGVYGKRKKKKS